MYLKKVKLNISWRSFFVFAMFSMFMLHLLGLIAPLRVADLYKAYGIVIIAACGGIYFSNKGVSGPLEIKLFIVYIAWILVSRWLNRDFYLLVDFGLLLSVLFSFLLFVTGTLLEKEQRERVLDCLTFFYAGFFVLVSIAGIFVTVTNTYIHVPPENVWITVISEGTLNSLNALSTPRLTSAARVFIAWTLLIYQLLKHRNFFLRALILLCIVTIHLTLALFHSRNIQIVLSVSYGMLALLVFTKLINKKAAPLRFMILSFITAAVVILCFYSFNWSNILVTKVHSYVAPRFETFYDNLDNKLNPDYFGVVLSAEELEALSEETATQEAAADAKASVPIQPSGESNLTDSRNIATNKTLTGRTEIWKSGILAVKQNPSIGIYGRLSNNFMDLINKVLVEQVDTSTTEYKSHMHNMFMQVLMLTGFPGLLLILCWTILMVKNMLTLYFTNNEAVTLALRALTIPIAGMFIYNLAEVVIFARLDICGMAFFMLGGIFLGYFYDFFTLSPKKEN